MMLTHITHLFIEVKKRKEVGLYFVIIWYNNEERERWKGLKRVEGRVDGKGKRWGNAE